MRCDVAPELGNWTMECTWMATVAFNHKVRVLELLKQHPSLRSCLWVTGSDNLRVNFRVPHHGSIAKIEAETAKAIPGLAPTETIVHLRSHKSMGWMLDRAGRCTGNLVCPPLLKESVEA